MERSPYIVSVKWVNESNMVTEYPTVKEQSHTAYPVHKTVSIINIDVANLVYTSIKIIKNRNVLYLDYGAKIIKLYKWVVIKPRVKGDTKVTYIGTNTYINTVIHIKIEFTVRKHRKCDPVFYENKGITCVKVDGSNLIFCCYGLGH